MKISLTAKNRVFFIVLFLFVIVTGIFAAFDQRYTLYICAVSFLLLVFFLLFFYREALVCILFFLVPLSVSLNIVPGTAINFPSEFLAVILAFTFVASFIFYPGKYLHLFRSPVTILILAELSWMFLSSFFSQMPGVSFKRVLVRACYISVYYFLVSGYLTRPKRIYFFISGYTAGMVYPVIHTLIAHSRFGFSTNAAYMMCFPFYKDHTIYGCALAFLCCFLGVLIVQHRQAGLTARTRTLLWGLAALLVTGLYFSYSRAAWLSIIGVLIFSVCLRYKVKLGVIIFVLALGTGTGIVFQKEIISRVRKTEAESNKGDVTNHIQSVANIRSDASNTERLNRWVCAYRMFLDKPLTGFGIGTYQFYYGKYQSRNYVTRISTFNGNKGHAHSEYFGALSETGLPGFIIFVVLVFIVIRTGVKLYYELPDPVDRTLVLSCLLALASFYIHAVFNGFLDTDKIASLVLISMAGITAVYVKNRSASSINQVSLS